MKANGCAEVTPKPCFQERIRWPLIGAGKREEPKMAPGVELGEKPAGSAGGGAALG